MIEEIDLDISSHRNNFYVSKRSVFPVLVWVALLCSACVNSEKKNQSKTSAETNRISENKRNTTQEMIDDIQQRVASINVENVPYIFNNAKVDILRQKLQSAKGNEKLNLLFTYGLELLNAGKTDESIAVLNQVLQVVESQNIPSKEELIFFIKKQQAIAYMRKAEQDNCIANHTNESCIVPISPKAQHIIKEGAQQSIL